MEHHSLLAYGTNNNNYAYNIAEDSAHKMRITMFSLCIHVHRVTKYPVLHFTFTKWYSNFGNSQ